MSAHALAPLAVAVPLVVAAVLAAAGRLLPRVVLDAVAVLTALASTAIGVVLVAGTGDGRVVSWVGGWLPTHGESVGVALVVDQISAGLVVLIGVLVTAALVFTWRYFDAVKGYFHALTLVFLAGMTGFATSGDIFTMFVFFELMGAAAYTLTAYKIEEPQAIQGALNFAVVNSLGAFVTLTGIAVLFARTGELNLAALGVALSAHHADGLVVAAFALVSTGWLVKSAVVPFHFWTADAEAVAPAPICALFSGVMVALGVYGVARVYRTVFSGVLDAGALHLPLLLGGAVTAIVGAVLCFSQHHLKRLLAYSTISHVGLFLLGVALLEPHGLAGSALYVLGHGGAKAALFLGTGILTNRFESVSENELHGRGRRMPITATIFVLGGLALAGAPPFGTWLGKSVTEEALSHAGYAWGPPLFVVASALTGGAVLRVALRVFVGLGRPSAEDHAGSTSGTGEQSESDEPMARVPVTMLAPALALLAGALAVGVLPDFPAGVAAAAARFVDAPAYAAQVLHGAPPGPVHVAAIGHYTLAGLVSGAVSTVLAITLALTAVLRHRVPEVLRRAGRLGLPPLRVLRQVHSGHLGDQVSWLIFGTAAFAALIGIGAR